VTKRQDNNNVVDDNDDNVTVSKAVACVYCTWRVSTAFTSYRTLYGSDTTLVTAWDLARNPLNSDCFCQHGFVT